MGTHDTSPPGAVALELEPDTRTDPVGKPIFARTSGDPCLVLIRGSPSLPRTVKLVQPRTLLGRSSTADLVLDDTAVSSQHCELILAEGCVSVKDLGSTNGTYVNGVKISQTGLADGDRLELGSGIVIKLTFQDVLDQQYQQALYEAATRDALTQTFNRQVVVEQLKLEFTYFRRRRSPLSVCIIDVDHFKKVNDTWGHPAGDSVLAEISKTIQAQLRTSDLFGRYGGEEFAAVLRDCDASNARIIGERIRGAVESLKIQVPYEGQLRDVGVTVSVGLATLHDDRYTSHEELLAEADKLLYQAKNLGRNRVVGSS